MLRTSYCLQPPKKESRVGYLKDVLTSFKAEVSSSTAFSSIS